MQTFDRQLWRSRALQRFERSPASRKEAAGTSYTRDTQAIDKLSILIDWCTKKHLTVVFGRRQGGLYERGKKLITLNCNLPPERQLFLLMHECGHHLIGIPSPEERYGFSEAFDPTIARTTQHRVDVVDEELEAWSRGRKLAGRLGIKVDISRYNRMRAEYVRTYLLWAAKVEGWTNEADEGKDG